MEVFFTSPTLGQIFGTITTEDNKNYLFTGKNVLINIDLCRTKTGWICTKEHWLHDSQIQELGAQIDRNDQQLSTK